MARLRRSMPYSSAMLTLPPQPPFSNPGFVDIRTGLDQTVCRIWQQCAAAFVRCPWGSGVEEVHKNPA